MSSDALAGFPWPAPPGAAAAPVWTGRQFAGGQRVLAYDAGQSHWSAELTELHESEAGADHPIDLASRALAVRTLVQHLPPRGAGSAVIDVGCSSGFVIEDIQRALPEAALIGADYLLAPLEKLGARLPNLPLLQFDLRRCPLPDACVDAVTALNVLEHIDDDRAALGHIARILKPGGVAHIEVPAGPGLYDIYDEHLMHHRRYRLADLLALARECGFQVIKGTHLGCLVYPMFALVKKRQRRLLSASPEVKRRQVAAQISQTSRSRVLAAAMRTELALGKRFSYPFGIRCIAVLRRNAG
jgi:ubiquinone/menaquinone biosynthesis C-methylase UbiE